MTKIDIFSGFLGAGKTTLIKKLISEAYRGEKLVLIENEFGEIGIDGGFMREAGIEVTEMNSGCICCSLVGDFGRALAAVLAEYRPDRILIEPSGVGKLSDVIRAVKDIEAEDAVLGGFVTVVDANKCKMYMKNFGEFFGDQIAHAGTVVLSHTERTSEAKLADCLAIVRSLNPDATLVTTPWSQITGEAILSAIEKKSTLDEALAKLVAETRAHQHHEHHHHEHDEDCDCGCHGHHHEHHHEHDEDCDCGCHGHHHEHHHEHDEDCDCGCHGNHHEHHHEHDEDCDCGCHEHHHEHGEDCDCGCHGHHADEVFSSWGVETARKFTKDGLRAALEALDEDSGTYGMILRAKGIVAGSDGGWLHFDYVPEEIDIRDGAADITGRLCVIGSGLHEDEIAKLFGVN